MRFCVSTSVGSESVFELATFKQCYPEGFFVSVQKNKWQYSMAAPILVKRWGGGWGEGWSAFYGGAVIIASYDRHGVNSKRAITLRGEKHAT